MTCFASGYWIGLVLPLTPSLFNSGSHLRIQFDLLMERFKNTFGGNSTISQLLTNICPSHACVICTELNHEDQSYKKKNARNSKQSIPLYFYRSIIDPNKQTNKTFHVFQLMSSHKNIFKAENEGTNKQISKQTNK